MNLTLLYKITVTFFSEIRRQRNVQFCKGNIHNNIIHKFLKIYRGCDIFASLFFMSKREHL